MINIPEALKYFRNQFGKNNAGRSEKTERKGASQVRLSQKKAFKGSTPSLLDNFRFYLIFYLLFFFKFF